MAERLGTCITPAIVARYPRPGMSIPARIAYSPDGKAITYLASERGDLVFDLWRFELETGRTEVLIRAAETGREAELSLQERLRRERLRRREVGITEYWWAAEAPVMLVPIEGDLYRWEAGSLRRLTSGAITPQISRDGRLVFFVRDGEVRVLDQDGERALTSGAQPGVGNGSAEYVAQEELDRYSGFWVSRDSRWLAFEQVDERHIPVYPIVHQGQDRIEIEEHRYPFAGADNVRWRLGVTPVAGDGARWLDLGDPEDHYLARVDWHPDGRLFIQRLRRDWRLLELLAFDPTTGRTSTLVSEQADPWINLHDDLRFDPRTGEFTWSSESGGFRRLSVHAPDGRLQRWLTWDDRPVDALLGLDALSRQVAFAAPSGSPLERHLYRVPLDGGAPVALTADGGTHHAVFAPDFSSLVEVFDSVRRPPAVVVRRLDGSRMAVLHEPERLDHDLRPPEFRSFESEEGVTLHAALYRPEGGPLPPILVSVYGGPATQTVQDTWALTVDMRAQMLAERGFLVVKIDNRGSPRRGLRFEAAIAGRLGDREVTDQAAGVRWLASLGLGGTGRRWRRASWPTSSPCWPGPPGPDRSSPCRRLAPDRVPLGAPGGVRHLDSQLLELPPQGVGFLPSRRRARPAARLDQALDLGYGRVLDRRLRAQVLDPGIEQAQAQDRVRRLEQRLYLLPVEARILGEGVDQRQRPRSVQVRRDRLVHAQHVAPGRF